MRAGGGHRVAFAGLLSLGVASSAEVRAQQPDAAQAATRGASGQPVVRREVNWALTIAGGIMLGVPYALGVPSAFLDHMQGGSAWMLAPVVGPLAGSFVVNNSGYACDFVGPYGNETDCNSPFFVELLWLDSLVQAAGAALLTVGLVGRPTVARSDASVVFAPSFSPGFAGLRVLGTL